ncbi:MAG: NAD(P)/FAD-dependent oxidoreductase [Candidatus Moraniibacteriota bacterium]
MPKTILIIGGGPAGLTAAYECLQHPGLVPIILEQDSLLGGISRTIEYKGNRIDIGGHRFFSKSDTVMRWWRSMLPLQGAPSKDDLLLKIDYRQKSRELLLDTAGPDPETTDRVMLVRSRLSRIYYLKKFFTYPIGLSLGTLSNLGPVRVVRIGVSYLFARLFPRTPEVSLEDFFINRFGNMLYLTFFKDYTEKVWGVPCRAIKAEWGAQRIKGLSITKAITHALGTLLPRRRSVDQKSTETSLIEHFLYPKYGPGQMWETVAAEIRKRGGTILMQKEVVSLALEGNQISSLLIRDQVTGSEERLSGSHILSTMPIKDLISRLTGAVPDEVRHVASKLLYRDFITVGLLMKKLAITNQTAEKTINQIIPDTWIYIQEPDVKVGRLQIFNNWSPYMVKDPDTVWIGLEYFVNEGDELWQLPDSELRALGVCELHQIGIIHADDVLDSTVIRMKKTYPSYTGYGYDHFSEIRTFVDRIENLFLIGRNGMHRYNNQDHSMLTAMEAVKNIVSGTITKDNIWDVNTEEAYHEEK